MSKRRTPEDDRGSRDMRDAIMGKLAAEHGLFDSAARIDTRTYRRLRRDAERRMRRGSARWPR